MAELTIQIPDDLAVRLQPVKDQMAEIIELGLREMASIQYILLSEVIDFLALGPDPQAIIAFRPSPEAQARVAEPLVKSRQDTLTTAERAERDMCEILDHIMTLIKARARHYLTKDS